MQDLQKKEHKYLWAQVTFKGIMKEKFIQNAIKKPGALRKSLHVKEGEKIPESKLKKAEHSKNPTTRKRAVLAETLSKLRKKK